MELLTIEQSSMVSGGDSTVFRSVGGALIGAFGCLALVSFLSDQLDASQTFRIVASYTAFKIGGCIGFIFGTYSYGCEIN